MTNSVDHHKEKCITSKRAARKARRLLSRLIPFEVWLSKKPRTSLEIDLYHRIVKELRIVANTSPRENGKMIAGDGR